MYTERDENIHAGTPALCDTMDVARQAPLSMGFPKQECESRLPFPPPEDLSDPGIKSAFPALQLVAQMVKRLPAIRETWVRSLGWEDPLEKEMATHSSIHAWKITWTEEPGGLQSMGSQRVGCD